MSPRHAVFALALSLASLAHAQPATAPAPLPTLADIQQIADAGQHRLALQQISRILPNSTPEVRAELFFLRAQSLIQLEDTATARQALLQVEREGARITPTESTRLVTARAIADRLLIENSRAGRVTLPGVEPAPLADTAARPALYQALFDQRLAQSTPELNQARTASDLPTISRVLPRMFELHALELAATGKTDRTGDLYTALGERARTLIDRELQVQQVRVNTIRDNASQSESISAPRLTGTVWGGVTVRRGLHSNDREVLRNIITLLGDILQTSEQAQSYAISLGRVPRGWDALITRTRVLGELAQSVLDRE